jgi:hypothetical protein
MVIGAKTSQPLKNATHQGILLIEFRIEALIEFRI